MTCASLLAQPLARPAFLQAASSAPWSRLMKPTVRCGKLGWRIARQPRVVVRGQPQAAAARREPAGKESRRVKPPVQPPRRRMRHLKYLPPRRWKQPWQLSLQRALELSQRLSRTCRRIVPGRTSPFEKHTSWASSSWRALLRMQGAWRTPCLHWILLSLWARLPITQRSRSWFAWLRSVCMPAPLQPQPCRSSLPPQLEPVQKAALLLLLLQALCRLSRLSRSFLPCWAQTLRCGCPPPS